MSNAKIIISAQDQASGVIGRIGGNLGNLQSVASRVSGALSLTGLTSLTGLVAMAQSTISGIDALNDLADATGASIENISALEDVAARTGTSMDDVTASLIKFNGVLNDAKPGSDAERSLKAIGLSAKELKAMDPAEALLKTAVALDRFADDGSKGRIEWELFGKSIKAMAPFLKDLADKGQLVATVTTEQAKAAEAFNQELSAMGKNAKDAARVLTTDLVTGINKAAKAWRESGAFAGLQTLLTGDDQHKNNKQLVDLTDQLLTAEKALGGFRAEGYTDGSRVVQNAKAQIAAIKEQIGVTMSYRKVLDIVASPTAPDKPSVGDVPGKPKGGKSQAQKDAEELAKTRMEMQRQVAIDAGDAVNKENQKLGDDSIRREQSIADERLKIQRQSILDEYDDRMKAQDDLEKARLDSIKEIAAKEKEFSDGLHNDLKGAFSAAFRDTSGEPLQAFGDAIANVIYSRAATALADTLIGAVGGSKSGSFLSDLLSFDGGGYTGSGARSGGVDGRGGFMAIMHPNESVLDHNRGQGGGGMVVNIVESPGNGGQTKRSSSGGTDVLTVFVEQVKASIANDISRGSGAVPSAMSNTYGLNRFAGMY